MANTDWTSTLTTGTGGVSTDEAGALTGEIMIRTFWSDSDKQALVTVKAVSGRDWYTMTGGPIAAPTEEAGHAVHAAAVHAARDGGAAEVTPPR